MAASGSGAADPARTPSPPPNAPIALTPGPRASQLNAIFNSTLSHTLKVCSYANFASCFPTPAAKTPKVLQAVHSQIVGKIESKSKTEFEAILKERKVVEGLNALEALFAEGRRRREASGVGKEGEAEMVPPHELPAEDLYNAHLSPLLAPIQAQLEEQLLATQKRNLELAEAVKQQRDEIERIVGALEAVVRDLEGANNVVGEAVEDGVRDEVKDVARELRDAARL